MNKPRGEARRPQLGKNVAAGLSGVLSAAKYLSPDEIEIVCDGDCTSEQYRAALDYIRRLAEWHQGRKK